MPPVQRLFRNLLERLLGRFYEGPAAPGRLGEEVLLFSRMHPLAGAQEWEEFATRLAEAAYRDGYVRGFEASERDPDAPALAPDAALGEALQHDWSLAGEHDRLKRLLRDNFDPADPMPGATPEERLEALARAGERFGTHRVVGLEADGWPVVLSDRSDSEEDEG